MRKTTAEARARDKGPVSVVLPANVKAAVEAEALRRGLKLSPAVRVLVTERLREIAEQEQLSRAEEWQRAQAWSAFQRVRDGGGHEVPRESLDADFEAARGKATGRARRSR